jgi:hypothetical protein
MKIDKFTVAGCSVRTSVRTTRVAINAVSAAVDKFTKDLVLVVRPETLDAFDASISL